MKLTREEAYKLIADKLSDASKALTEAERVADEYNLSFDFNAGGYGMGGWYEGGDGWQASSSSC